MQHLLFLGLFLLALIIGWYLGRREAIKVGVMLQPHGSAIDKQYFIGLNYLLNEQPDEAIETFIRALEVNPETVETHIAIGKLFCQRGDVERAIKVHQNLLARPNLSRQQADSVQLELARDYLVVGLDQRAERLLQELINARSPLRADAMTELVKVHERGHDWAEAIHIGLLLVREQPEFAIPLAHYYCEQARVPLQRGEWPMARRLLMQALKVDRHCVRAMLLLAELEHQAERPVDCSRWLQRLVAEGADFVPQALSLARWCKDNGNLDFLAYLDRVLAASDQPPVAVVLAKASELRQHDEGEALRFVQTYARRQPSLGLLRYLMTLPLTDSTARDLEHQVVADLVADWRPYRCQSCGFAARELHWQCPTCHHWSSMRPVQNGHLPGGSAISQEI
ncbi:tetratricopeptide repeat protein [Halopseudomonas salegens]|uniref:Lipopolysaccharide assembly protein B n=1 Tax=Halopseudomonas salegens TaxID=1434072 RepID=A0A1H2G511_9GAMM|nr:tetratricopeptide repeat protein [Halopseudomonas salegens]SDU14736.1 Lipopolysaccharide biosynthesis regulator YciM, contains six TPR domains and a predicted metal-binding C-terminal domain [Halopseudomonas salegens]